MSIRAWIVACLVALTSFAAAAEQTPTPARLAGRVVSAGDGGGPVRRAIVKITGSGLSQSRTTITDDRGEFIFVGVPSGRFMVTASRAGYITGSYGAKIPGRPGTPLTIAPGQQLTEVIVPMARGAVVTGTIVDGGGDPMPGVQVVVVRNGQVVRPAVSIVNPAPSAGDVVTDDRGVYRLFGLEPGTYLVVAALRTLGNNQIGVLSAAEIDAGLAVLQQRSGVGGAPATAGSRSTGPAPTDAARVPAYGLLPIYYPGVSNAAQATAVTVAAGEERNGVDMVLRPVATTAIEGTVLNPAGPVPPGTLNILPEVPVNLPAYFNAAQTFASNLRNDGTFRYPAITPGRYVITVRTAGAAGRGGGVAVAGGGGGGGLSALGPPPGSASQVLWASATVTASGADITGLTLTLRPALHVTGRIRFDATTATPPEDLSAIRITFALPPAGTLPAAAAARVIARAAVPMVFASADGAFDIAGVVPGFYAINAVLPTPGPWWLRSAMLEGRDVLDTLVEVSDTGRDLSDAILTFSDRRAELTGTLQTPAGAPATDYVVVAFTTDRTLWRPQGRRMLFTRPATDGQFSIRDLPPGDYYVAAVTDLDPNDWQHAEFLDQVIPAALKITIGEGEQKRQDVRLR